MKPFYLLFLLLIGSVAWGQADTGKLFSGSVTSVVSAINTEQSRPAHWACDEGFEMDQVTTSDHPWCHKSAAPAVKPKSSDLLVQGSTVSTTTTAPLTSFTFGNITCSIAAEDGFLKCEDSQGATIITPIHCENGLESCAITEPIEVPAIREPVESEWENAPISCQVGAACIAPEVVECSHHGHPVKDKSLNESPWMEHCEAGWEYGCAEKSRILEHSEDGKYWCRKVQP